MLIRLMILASVLVTGMLHAVEVPSPLDEDRGKFRPLVIVARAQALTSLVKLEKSLKDEPIKQQLQERDVVLYTILGGEVKREGKAFDAQQAAALIRGLKSGMIMGDVKVILIGKDGEKKLEAKGDIDLNALINTIDNLPPAEKQTPAQVQVVPQGKAVPSGKGIKPAKPVKALED